MRTCFSKFFTTPFIPLFVRLSVRLSSRRRLTTKSKGDLVAFSLRYGINAVNRLSENSIAIPNVYYILSNIGTIEQYIVQHLVRKGILGQPVK